MQEPNYRASTIASTLRRRIAVRNTPDTKWDWEDLIALTAPALIFIEFVVVGKLFLSEIILALTFIAFILTKRAPMSSRIAKRFMWLCFFWLIAQGITDVVQESLLEDWTRGSARIIFLSIDFLAIYFLFHNKPSRIRLMAVGMAIGSILGYFFNPSEFAAEYPWKFGFGTGVTLFAIILTLRPSVMRRPFMPGGVLGLMAAVNLYLGFRSMGAICFIASIYLLSQPINARRKYLRKSANTLTVFVLASIAVTATYGTGAGYQYLVEAGYFGEAALEKYEYQSTGDFGVLIGGRPELLVSLQAISDSPILGHGSWAKNSEYGELQLIQLTRYGYKISGELDSDLILTHSHLFGGWVEAGIVGGMVWIWTIFMLTGLLLRLYQSNHPLTPLVVFGCLFEIWTILFSPLGAEARIITAFYVAMATVVADDLQIS